MKSLLFAARPAVMGKVLGIVYRCIATRLIKKAGFSCAAARTDAISLHSGDRLLWTCSYRRHGLSNGHVRHELKTAYRDGTTHVIFEPLEFSRSRHPASCDISASLHVIARLVALVPKPRSTSLGEWRVRLDQRASCASDCFDHSARPANVHRQ